jgi:hypothetical protein
MLLRDGTIVDSYLDFGPVVAGAGLVGRPEAAQARHVRQRGAPQDRQQGGQQGRQHGRQQGRAAEAVPPLPMLVTRISRDGGRTWTDGGVIARQVGVGPVGIRCCLPSATSDPVTDRVYTAWSGVDPRELLLSTSTDGRSWSAPRRVNRGTGDSQAVNVDISAYGGTLGVSYGLTNADINRGRFARQYVTTTRDAGASFTPTAVVGPRSEYRFAAQAGGIFPGDYIGSAMRGDVLYAVWCVSSRPPRAGAAFHQVEYGATFDTREGLRRAP